ncbi:MAG: hypothetical protein N3A69_11345 [Leptospiraceae bacterium]|nr:hypothetical protein [Leptospiraceae bacterium]
MVELYYRVGLELCTNDWILHLEDDEEPSDELLKDLKKLTAKNTVYSVCRFDMEKRRFQRLFRLFYKDFIIPTGLIHFTWVSKIEPIELEEKYNIVHYELDLNIKKLKKYAVYESWQYAYKIIFSIFSFYKYKNKNNFIKKIKKILFLQSKLGKIGWFLLATEYNLYMLFAFIKSRSPRPLYSLLYWLFIQINLFKKFSVKLEASLKMIEKGVFEFLGLDSYENALKSLEGLNSKNGLENFVKLVEKRLQIFKS